MDAFLIPGTKNSPKIDFRPDNGIFEISGKSFHENPQKIYSGTLDWIKKLTLPSDYNGCLSINLTYISSNSMIYLLRILKAIEEVTNNCQKFTIKWHYYEDDELIKTAGEDLEEMVNLQFEYIGLE